MSSDRINKSSSEEGKMPTADTGNASNPTPHGENIPVTTKQVLGKQAEKYIRESGNIEDMPDAQDEENADKGLDNKVGKNSTE
jgi:hypothetical protein